MDAWHLRESLQLCIVWDKLFDFLVSLVSLLFWVILMSLVSDNSEHVHTQRQFALIVYWFVNKWLLPALSQALPVFFRFFSEIKKNELHCFLFLIISDPKSWSFARFFVRQVCFICWTVDLFYHITNNNLLANCLLFLIKSTWQCDPTRTSK